MTIGLKVDNGTNSRGVVAGSILHGRIYLHNDTPVSGHSIRLKMSGIEEAVVHHTSTESSGSHHHYQHSSGHRHNRHHGSHGYDTQTIDNYERHSDTFYSIDHTIKEFPGGVIPRGQFEFPFALQLPKSLPSSMAAAQDSQSHCKVRYEVVAEVYQKPNTIFYSNPQAKESLTVVAMPSTVTPRHDSSLHLPAEIVPISTCNCCCFASCTKIGTMALEAKFDKTTLFLDAPSVPASKSWNNSRRQPFQSEGGNASQHTFGVQFRCENKSTERVKNVKTQLVETIEWSVNGKTASVKTTLATSTRDASLYPELKAMWHKPFQWEQHSYSNAEATSPLLDAKPWRTMDPSLRVDGTQASDTYRGSAVKVRHVLSFQIRTEGCCSTNPDASALVEIYRNPVAFGASEASFGEAASKQTAPSAPFEADVFATAPAASAPPSTYDSSYAKNPGSQQVPMAQASVVLPQDWNAHTEEVVSIPIVEATVVHN